MNTEVLIVGAGPTGLVMALWLNRLGVRVRIIDKTGEAGTTSRAMVVHARILEQYDQMGIADPIIAQGVRMSAANLWVGGRKVARAPFGEMGKGLSPFPFSLIYPQDAHERFLVQMLKASGIEVERRTQLVSFEDSGDMIRARIRNRDGLEADCECLYIAGCDGARSTVRDMTQAGFPGGTYAHVFYVADVKAEGAVVNGELHVALDGMDFVAVFPLVDRGHVRLVGLVKDAAANERKTFGWEDVSKSILERTGIKVHEVRWFSTYHVHHRVANAFRRGRAFLLGDAAHIHSPVGGQGMNTGIGDAINLAWKIAWVLRGGADPSVLDTFECERRAFALRLVGTTDRLFTFATQDGALARFVRTQVAPRLIPAVFSTRAAQRFMFRTVSQTAIHYRGCALSSGAAGSLQGGDRLPWVRLGTPQDGLRDNYEPLRSVRWQMHLYGEATAEVKRYCEEKRFPLHVFAWRRSMEGARLVRNALYLVRPDGYIAAITRPRAA